MAHDLRMTNHQRLLKGGEANEKVRSCIGYRFGSGGFNRQPVRPVKLCAGRAGTETGEAWRLNPARSNLVR
jgi:hypothetical protein